MTKIVYALLIVFFLGACTDKSRWPSDIKPGVGVLVNRNSYARVVKVDREWLTITFRNYDGTLREVSLPREQVNEISVLDYDPTKR